MMMTDGIDLKIGTLVHVVVNGLHFNGPLDNIGNGFIVLNDRKVGFVRIRTQDITLLERKRGGP